MRPCRRNLPVALALLLAATAFGAHGSVPAGYQTQSTTALAPGVDHESLTLADPPQAVHVARVAPGAARLATISSHDLVANQDIGAELPSDMCRRVGCFAAINADFRDDISGQPLGGVVSNGRLLRSPAAGRPQLIVTRDGRLQAGPLDWSGSITASDGRAVALGGVNVPARPGDVMLYTPAWGGPTPGGADTELIVRSAGTIGTIGATTPVQIVAVRRDAGPIPADGAVLVASGSAAAALQDFASRADAGAISRTVDLRIRTALDVVESVGGHPTILREGQPAFADIDDSFTRARHPRAMVGWNAAGEVMLVTVDAGRAGASGMTLAEAADLLVGLGATDGFGFDNSAATFVAAGAVQNLPIDDGDPAVPPPTDGRQVAPGHMERPTANALMVMAKHPAPPDSPPATNPGNGSGAKPGGGTTATTVPGKLTTAGGGAAPTTGGVAAPTPAGGTALLPGVGDILRDPTTKRPRRQGGKGAKGTRNKDGHEEEAYAGDPSIPDWNDITAALTPQAVAGNGEESELSFGSDPDGPTPPGAEVGPILLRLLAGGMIVSVLWGLQRVRDDSRSRRAIWL